MKKNNNIVLVFALLLLALPVFAQIYSNQISLSGLNHIGSGRLATAVADYNGDGFSDLFITRSGGTDYLYQNTGSGTFIDVSSSSGINALAASRDVDFIDYDADGDLDIYVTNYDMNSVLYRNDNNFFTDVAATVGLTNGIEKSRNVAWFDYDADGDLDVFIANGALGTPITNPGDPYIAKTNSFFENDINNSGTFINKTVDVGLDIAADWVMINPADINNDGYPDLLLVPGLPDLPSNPNLPLYYYRVLLNEKNGTFKDVTSQSGIVLQGTARGTAWGDYDNDGDLDLFIANDNFDSVSGNLVAEPKFYRNDISAGLRFTDVTVSVGISTIFDQSYAGGRACQFSDYDRDGDLDLLVLNSKGSKNKILENISGSFADITSQELELTALDASGNEVHPYGAVFEDFNLDGDFELFVINNKDQDQIFGNSIVISTRDSFKLRILDSNGIQNQHGAIVELLNPVDFSVLQSRAVSGANSYLSQGSYDISFTGLDENTEYGFRVKYIGGLTKTYGPITPLNAFNSFGQLVTITM
ncbi:MAG: VCBS repeat-containing protein [Candidatus Caenarcaniphilales bacterium]|nr:VCBS repeat-containing protein [Candidatus Caenarcaniphilales bacterium]